MRGGVLHVVVVSLTLSACLGAGPRAGDPRVEPAPTEAQRPVPLLIVPGHVTLDYYTGMSPSPPGHNFTRYGITQAARTLGEWGHGGPRVRVGFYAADTMTDLDVHDHPATLANHGHDRHEGDAAGHTPRAALAGRHGVDAPVEHLAYHLAWLVHDQYHSNGTCVDLLGHSMGGIVIRYAIGAVAKQREPGFSDFPESMCVRNAITIGAPHAGTDVARGCDNRQCQGLRPGSPLMQRLAEDPAFRKPQGQNGTRWTVIGSDLDESDSPFETNVAMEADRRIMYLASSRINHNGRLTAPGGQTVLCWYLCWLDPSATAHARARDAGASVWSPIPAALWPLRTIFERTTPA